MLGSTVGELGDLNIAASFLAGSGSGELGELSPEYEDFVSLEIGEVLSPLLLGEGLSEGALCEFFGDSLLGDDGSKLASAGAPADLEHLAGELQSADGDDLALDVLAVDEHSLVVENVHDGGQFALQRTVGNPSNTANFHEFAVTLSREGSTICNVW